MTDYPIPFPLSQMITLMLLVHWMTTALVCATSVTSPLWAGILSFFVIMAYWSINFIAVELEMPFGDDLNDLPIYEMQRDLNASLTGLLQKQANRPPVFDFMPTLHTQLCLRSLKMDQ